MNIWITRMVPAGRRHWTRAEIDFLRISYPDTPTVEIAARLGRGIRATYEKANALGIGKSAAFLASSRAGRFDGVRGLPTRFKPGQTPWNKGTHFSAGGRSAETRFRKGQKPHTWNPVGHERITKDGILQRKVSDTGCTPRDYKAVHTLVWEAAHGPVPKGHIVVFRDRDRRNFALANLECISRTENMRRNSVHRLPKEVAQAVQLRGALNRKINRITKERNGQRDDR